MKYGFLSISILFALSIIGCSDSQTESSNSSSSKTQPQVILNQVQGIPRVVESFEVGNDVFVRALAVEKSTQSLWVGTSVGVHEIDLATQTARNTFTRDAGLANEYVFAIMADSRGYKWFGTNGGGISRYRDSEWKTYFPMHGLADYWVYSFAEQSDGTVWIGTWAGVNRFDVDGENFVTYFDELVNEWVYGVGVDSQDRIWFGTEGGVSMFNGSSWQAWTHDNGLGAPNADNLPISTNTGLGTRTRHDLNVMSEGQSTYNMNYVFCIHIDNNDSVWAGTWGGGVSRYDGKRWQNLTVNDGLAGNIVFSIAQDKQGVYWFGTDQGVSRYDGKSWHTIGPQQGLLGESVYAVAAAPSGEIWAGTKGGVTRIGY